VIFDVSTFSSCDCDNCVKAADGQIMVMIMIMVNVNLYSAIVMKSLMH